MYIAQQVRTLTNSSHFKVDNMTFNEDEALTIAERTFRTEINEQLGSDIIQYASRLHSRYQQTGSNVATLVELLAEARYYVISSTEPVRGGFIDEIGTAIEVYREQRGDL